jgi:hypothetical protein
MGDRCYVSLTCRREDQELFEDIGFCLGWDEKREGNSPFIEMEAEQANYAAYDDLHVLAEQGVPFYGSHDQGGDYAAGIFASAGGEIAWPDQVSGDPAVRIDEEGNPFAGDIDIAKQYYRLLKAAQRAIMGEPAQA